MKRSHILFLKELFLFISLFCLGDDNPDCRKFCVPFSGELFIHQCPLPSGLLCSPPFSLFYHQFLCLDSLEFCLADCFSASMPSFCAHSRVVFCPYGLLCYIYILLTFKYIFSYLLTSLKSQHALQLMLF